MASILAWLCYGSFCLRLVLLSAGTDHFMGLSGVTAPSDFLSFSLSISANLEFMYCKVLVLPAGGHVAGLQH